MEDGQVFSTAMIGSNIHEPRMEQKVPSQEPSKKDLREVPMSALGVLPIKCKQAKCKCDCCFSDLLIDGFGSAAHE